MNDNNDTCGWTWHDGHSYWTTACGNSISDDATSIEWNYCPWCGKKIKDGKKHEQ